MGNLTLSLVAYQEVRSLENTLLAKLTRTVTAFLPVDDNRAGECMRCGKCCCLPFTCPFLAYGNDGLATCTIHAVRPMNCRKYPRSAAEQICAPCGYVFRDDGGVG